MKSNVVLILVCVNVSEHCILSLVYLSAFLLPFSPFMRLAPGLGGLGTCHLAVWI